MTVSSNNLSLCVCVRVCATAVRENNTFDERDADERRPDAMSSLIFWGTLWILLTFPSSCRRVLGLNPRPPTRTCTPLQVSQVSLQVLQK